MEIVSIPANTLYGKTYTHKKNTKGIPEASVLLLYITEAGSVEFC